MKPDQIRSQLIFSGEGAKWL